jgi:hypothetical protein
MPEAGDDLERRVARWIGEAIELNLDRSADEASASFRVLEAELVALSEDSLVRIEIRRRLAEVRLSEFHAKVDGLKHFHEAWDNIERLGYSALEREASMLFFRASGLLAHDLREHVAPILGRLDRIVDSGMDGQQSMAEHFRLVAERVRARSV